MIGELAQKHKAPDQLCLRIHALTLQGGVQKRPLAASSFLCQTRQQQPRRLLAHVRDDDILSRVWFTGNVPRRTPEQTSDGNKKGRPDDRTLRLGKSVRVLHDRLPTLLASPLPQEILSPQITLHLFPSTHPHLPAVSGRISYTAALWTAPVAWGRVPVVGNVRLTVLSERMVRNGSTSPSYRQEKLIVRWKTCGKTKGRGTGGLYRGVGGSGDQVDKITEFLGGDVSDDEEFSGLFIFEFDEEGRVVSHTIEHAEQGGNFERMTRVVSVTDWLIGLAKGRGMEGEPGYALGYIDTGGDKGLRKSLEDRRDMRR